MICNILFLRRPAQLGKTKFCQSVLANININIYALLYPSSNFFSLKYFITPLIAVISLTFLTTQNHFICYPPVVHLDCSLLPHFHSSHSTFLPLLIHIACLSLSHPLLQLTQHGLSGFIIYHCYFASRGLSVIS